MPTEWWRRCQRKREAVGAPRERKSFSAFKQDFSALSYLQGWAGAVAPSLSLSLARRGMVSWRFRTCWLRMGDSKSSNG